MIIKYHEILYRIKVKRTTMIKLIGQMWLVLEHVREESTMHLFVDSFRSPNRVFALQRCKAITSPCAITPIIMYRVFANVKSRNCLCSSSFSLSSTLRMIRLSHHRDYGWSSPKVTHYRTHTRNMG